MFGSDDPTIDPGQPRDAAAETSSGVRRSGVRGGSGAEPRGEAVEESSLRRVGGFTVLRVLGKGGMGVVFEAEQRHPRRRVALKVIRASRVSPELLRRFEYESQILARLEHPGIARIYQAGTLKDRHGRTTPYFSMELIEGAPLTSWVASGDLGTRERLELMARVCDAVYHAHQKGVIHRDLKPGNILVDREGQPKILDFGVARATSSDVALTTLGTDVGQLVGTVQYMSPEQASGQQEDVDTRSDVYALGVILFEVLTGQLPYDVRRKMLHEAVRTIREDDPARLSSLNRTLRGDVETIVAKAMEKERERRYQSADALAADIRRYLGDEAITARPAGTWYRIGKFSRRNRGLTVGILGVVVAVIAGLVATGAALARAMAAESRLVAELDVSERALAAEARERQRADEERVAAEAARVTAEEARRAAERERERAALAEAQARQQAVELEQVVDFQAGILRSFDPARAGRQLTADVLNRLDAAARSASARAAPAATASDREAFTRQWEALNATDLAREFVVRAMLEPAASSLEGRFESEPLIGARLRQVLADSCTRLGMYDLALPLQEQALETRSRLLGDDHPLTRVSRRSMGDLLFVQGRSEEAGVHYREAKEQRPARRRSAIARVLEMEGREDEAEEHVRAQLAQARLARGDDHLSTLRLVEQLGSLLHRQGRLEEAEPLLREAASPGRRRVSQRNPDRADFLISHGAVLIDLSRLDEAELALRESLELHTEFRGAEHPRTLLATIALGSLHGQSSRHQDAVDLLAPAESAARAAFAARQPVTLAALLSALGTARLELGRFDEAERNLLEAFAFHGGDVEGVSPLPAEAQELALRLGLLYDRWHAAAPGAGHDGSAKEWRGRAGRTE